MGSKTGEVTHRKRSRDLLLRELIEFQLETQDGGYYWFEMRNCGREDWEAIDRSFMSLSYVPVTVEYSGRRGDNYIATKIRTINIGRRI